MNKTLINLWIGFQRIKFTDYQTLENTWLINTIQYNTLQYNTIDNW